MQHDIDNITMKYLTQLIFNRITTIDLLLTPHKQYVSSSIDRLALQNERTTLNNFLNQLQTGN